MIDWKARLRHPATYTALVGLAMLFINRFAPLEVDFMTDFFNLLGAILITVGVVVDTSSPGMTDKESDQH